MTTPTKLRLRWYRAVFSEYLLKSLLVAWAPDISQHLNFKHTFLKGPLSDFLKTQMKHTCLSLLKSWWEVSTHLLHTVATQLLCQRFAKTLTDHSHSVHNSCPTEGWDCPMPANFHGKVGLCSAQPGLVEDVSAHGGGFGLDGLWRSLQFRLFHDSMTLYSSFSHVTIFPKFLSVVPRFVKHWHPDPSAFSCGLAGDSDTTLLVNPVHNPP